MVSIHPAPPTPRDAPGGNGKHATYANSTGLRFMKRNAVYAGCLALALLLTAGCASPVVELKPPYPYDNDSHPGQHSWHSLRFQWDWPEGREPDWSLDALVADLVVSDLIGTHRGALPLWRFHRRAGRDPAGHQFSFIFYSTPRMAREIEHSAASHPVTSRLLEQERLERVYVTRPENASQLSAASDRSWPESMQSTWPVFIMGVSQAWLGLVELHAGNTKGLEDDLDAATARYEEVNNTVNELWSEYAQHVYFHHLSGVFGYAPLKFRKRMRF